jgi:hypothetical protein
MPIEEYAIEESPFSTAPACRLKAESMRMAAGLTASPRLAQAYLKIAQSWEDIAADYDSPPAA